MSTEANDVTTGHDGAVPFDALDLAHRLVAARRSTVPVTPPPGMSKAQGTEVKSLALGLLSENGRRRVVGYKVSMSYTWGALTEDVVLPSPAVLRRAELFDPLVETEAVFRLHRDVSPDASLDDIIDSAHVIPAIEVADCRWTGWCPSDRGRFRVPTAAELEADNALSSWLVLGSDAVPARHLPLPDVRVTAQRNGEEIATGMLSHVMGHPAQVVRWLAQELAAVGEQLRAGQIVATGNPYNRLVTCPPEGGRFDAVIDGVGRATVTFTGPK